MQETAIQLNNMSAEIESMVFRMILFKGITAIVLLAILVYVIYKLIKYYETGDNKDLKEWLYETSIDGINLNDN